MLDLCRLIFWIASDLLRSRVAREAEILMLRQQINVLRRANPKRRRFVSVDRLIWEASADCFPRCMMSLQSSVEMRQLIHQMSGANPLWGAPRIRGELLKLGIGAD